MIRNLFGGLLENYTAVSGVCVQDDRPELLTYNPKLYRPPEISQTPLICATSDENQILTDSMFIDYAEKLQEAGRKIIALKPDIVLVPMRGGVRPWEHLRVYCNIEPLGLCFPFQGEEKTADETCHILLKAFLPFMGRESLKVTIIDAAEGGHGSRKLGELLRRIHDSSDPKSHWVTCFYLFIPVEKRNADWQHELRRESTESFEVHVEPFPLIRVIGEDWDEAMILPQNLNRLTSVQVESGWQLYVIETYSLPEMIDQKIAEATYLLHFTQPHCRVIDIRDWSAGQRKADMGGKDYDMKNHAGHSVASNLVDQEIETVLAGDLEQTRTMLFLVRLDDAIVEIKTGWPAHIKNTRHIGDFRHWKDHDTYETATFAT